MLIKKNITKLKVNQHPTELILGYEWVIVNDIESKNMAPIQDLLINVLGYKWPSDNGPITRRGRFGYIVHSHEYGNFGRKILFGDQNLHKYESNGVRIFKASELI